MDQTTETQTIQKLSPIVKDKTLLLVTQKMSTLALCNRIIVFNHGVKVMDGAKDEVVKQLAAK